MKTNTSIIFATALVVLITIGLLFYNTVVKKDFIIFVPEES